MFSANDYTKTIAAGERELCFSWPLPEGWIAPFEPTHECKSAIKVSFSAKR